MNLPAVATDNITEILLKIIEFTQTRQKILIRNINAMHTAGFVPKDLPADEFAKLMCFTINEHLQSRRLVLRDGPNVKFGFGGTFKTNPIIDEGSRKLLETNRDGYLRRQILKLLENSLNQRIATELLKKKQLEEQFVGRCLN
jgi:flagellar basal body rod protein FlgB